MPTGRKHFRDQEPTCCLWHHPFHCTHSPKRKHTGMQVSGCWMSKNDAITSESSDILIMWKHNKLLNILWYHECTGLSHCSEHSSWEPIYKKLSKLNLYYHTHTVLHKATESERYWTSSLLNLCSTRADEHLINKVGVEREKWGFLE